MPGWRVAADDELVRLGVTLLALARTSARTATYKPATLLALVDVLAARVDPRGSAPDVVPLVDLAERVIALYWPQVREYDGLDRRDQVLRQISDRNKVSVIVRSVREYYVEAVRQGARSPGRAAVVLPGLHASTVDAVARNLRRYPLERLQRPGGWRQGQDYERPLYDDRHFGAGSREVELRLHPGAGERLVALSGLLVPVLQAEWTQQVASLNELPSEDLRRHLFGEQRADLGPVRDVLRQLQDGRCLYCGRTLSSGGQVDHVVPWSLHPQDAIENLALAHDACNGAKGAHLLDLAPLRAWASRDLDELALAAGAVPWRSDPTTVFGLARSAYAHSGAAQLWRPGRTRPMQPDDQRSALELLSRA